EGAATGETVARLFAVQMPPQPELKIVGESDFGYRRFDHHLVRNDVQVLDDPQYALIVLARGKDKECVVRFVQRDPNSLLVIGAACAKCQARRRRVGLCAGVPSSKRSAGPGR